MRRFAGFVLVSTIAGVFSLPAIAADLPSRMEPVAPVAYVPAFSWTGFYLGGELGLDTNERPSTPPAPSCWGRLSSSRRDLTRTA